MFTIAAPHPNYSTTTLLPNPQFSDSQAVLGTVSRRIMMDGTRYTYVKRKDHRYKLRWTFKLTRNKSLELRAFLGAFFGQQVAITDHHGHQWLGCFVNNPFEFDTSERAAPAISPLPRGENVVIDLEFEGGQQ